MNIIIATISQQGLTTKTLCCNNIFVKNIFVADTSQKFVRDIAKKEVVCRKENFVTNMELPESVY